MIVSVGRVHHSIDTRRVSRGKGMTGESVMKRDTGLIMVVSAPSGAGKSSVLAGLLENHPELAFSISVTTRSPRNGERSGVHYTFVSDDEFDRMIGGGEFAEWAEVHGHRYGTLKKTLDDALARGASIVLDTDTVGAFNIRKLYGEAVLVFVVTPTPGILEKRLRDRNTEPEEVVRRRLDAFPREIARMGDYDYIIVNDRLDSAIKQLETIYRAEMMKSSRMIPLLTEWRKYIDGKEAVGS